MLSLLQITVRAHHVRDDLVATFRVDFSPIRYYRDTDTVYTQSYDTPFPFAIQTFFFFFARRLEGSGAFVIQVNLPLAVHLPSPAELEFTWERT